MNALQDHFPTQKEFVADRLYIGEKRFPRRKLVYIGPLGKGFFVRPTIMSIALFKVSSFVGNTLGKLGFPDAIAVKIVCWPPFPAPALLTFDGAKHEFDWGYEGPKPAALARTILAMHLMDFPGLKHNSSGAAERLHTKFMSEVIAKLPADGFSLLGSDVTAWCEANGASTPTHVTATNVIR